MREIEKYDCESGTWEKTKIKCLEVGDIFRVFDNGKRYADPYSENNVWIVESLPYYENDNWVVNTLY